jgi:phosphate transport system permease protein
LPEGSPRHGSGTIAEAPVRRRLRFGDPVLKGATLIVAVGLLGLLALLLWSLAQGAVPTFARFGWSFFTGRQWDPVNNVFGALPYIYGTLVTSAIALILALPVSVGLALLLNEVRSRLIRNPLTVLVDLLAAIPSIVYGLWGLFVMAPFLNTHLAPVLAGTLGKVPGLGALFVQTPAVGNMLNAGIILAVMIVPIITAVSREVIATVPRDLREAALALGATRYESIRMAVLPYAKSGIVGATMLGLGRALGETIAVSMVIGNGLGISSSLLAPGYTIPAVIANEFREATSTGLQHSSLLALALVLVAISLLLAAASRLLLRRSEKMAS